MVGVVVAVLVCMHVYYNHTMYHVSLLLLSIIIAMYLLYEYRDLLAGLLAG